MEVILKSTSLPATNFYTSVWLCIGDKLLQVPVMDRGSYTEQWLNNICVQHSSCSSKKKPAVKLSKWIDLTVNFISHKEKESAMLIKQCDNAIVAVKCSPLSCLLEKVQTTPNLGYHTSQIQSKQEYSVIFCATEFSSCLTFLSFLWIIRKDENSISIKLRMSLLTKIVLIVYDGKYLMKRMKKSWYW